MKQVAEILLSLPTVGFTIAMAFCLSWWVSSFVIGGIEPNHSSHGADPHFHPVGRTGAKMRSGARSARLTSRGATLAAVPMSLRWTVGTAVAWSTCLISTIAVRSLIGPGMARNGLLAAVAIASFLMGRSASHGFSRLVQPIFVTPEAPTKSSLVGSHGKVRSLEITETRGEAKLIDGSSAGAIVRVRIDASRSPSLPTFVQGDIVQLVDYFADDETYIVDAAEALLLDDPV
jgi:hypothetical protein